MTGALRVRKVTAADADRVAEIFLTSRRAAMPWLARPHTDDETRQWHRDVLVPRGTVVVAAREGEVVGFAEPVDGWLQALYVAGCVEVRRTGGTGNEEGEPDVLLRWLPRLTLAQHPSH